MNNLDIIRAFAGLQTSQNTTACSKPVKNGEPYLAALKALAQSNEWLQDQALTELVASKLETIEPQSPEARAQTVAIYMKLINPKSLQKPIRLNTVQIRISNQVTVDLPKAMLMAESAVLQRFLSKTPDQPIDLSGKASKENLTNLTTHLTTGETGFVTDENAVELLLLAKELELTELAMTCLERLLTPSGKGLIQTSSQQQASDAENKLRDLLKEVRNNLIVISRSEEGTAHIQMMDGSQKGQWECLRRLHAYIPVTHLELTKRKNLDCLLDFCKHNPGIVSLNLDDSPDITDIYLEQLSQNLSSLRSFSICSAPIKAIPQSICERVTNLNCYGCRSLTSIRAENALKLNCRHCHALISINAPSAATIDCELCLALTSLNADSAVTLNCNSCRSLTTLSAPKGITVICGFCAALTSISIPNALTLDCHYCDTLTSIDAPCATTVDCHRCSALTRIDAPSAITLDCNYSNYLVSINAPKALTLDCYNCSSLTSISAPNVITLCCYACCCLTSINAPVVTTLYCNNCDALASISAPEALTLDCHSCSAIVSVNAPSASTVYCTNCPVLININIPSATTLDMYGCHGLTSEVKLKLFNTIRRNIILTDYRYTEILIEHLSEHAAKATSRYGLMASPDFPLERWFIEAQELSIPAEFDLETEKLECEKNITSFYERLIAYAANESTLQGVDLSWFNDLRKLDSPQQQRSRVVWLGSLLACAIPGENPLADREALPTLKAIGNLGDPFLQDGASRALFSMYYTETSDRTNTWRALRTNRPDHQLILCLFFGRATIDMDLANQLMDGLNTRYYRDIKVLGPILEMLCLLSSDYSMTALEREKVLRLVLKAPEKGPREKTKQFAQQLKKYRAEQPMWVNACRDLLFFGKASELKGTNDVNELLERRKRACQAVFGVKEELLHSFVDTFKSQRYPNGLFSYAARLHTTTVNRNGLLTKLLGKFVNGVLDGGFPDNRYDISNNKHLKTIFQGNEALFIKWKEPLEIQLEQTESLCPDQDFSPRDAVHDLMKRAFANNHLGAHQARVYRTLEAALETDDLAEALKNIPVLEKRLHDMRALLQTTEGENLKHLKHKLSQLEIEILCLQALDPRFGLTERVEILNTLLAKLPDGIEFRNDVSGMLSILKPSKSSQPKWVKTQTTESWEDFLLMGTEVKNSCQRIDGDPNLNKCLLSYILDGKNKLMIVRDSNGKIAARSVLRILWDDKRKLPVLFMEQIYTAKADPALQRLIMDGCVEKAKRMGLPLVARKSGFPIGPSYTGQLSALGGPAPFEYVDALSGIQKDGMFTLTSSNIIYTPNAE